MAYQYYNMTNFTNIGNDSTILTFVQEVNNQMNAAPTLLILSAIYVLLLVSLISRGFGVTKTFAVTSFVMMIMAIITYPMQLINGRHLLIFVILFPFALAILWIFPDEP